MADSVTRWISGLLEPTQGNRDQHLQSLWDRYFGRLVAVARKRLGSFPRKAADEEDIAPSVFGSLCPGWAAAGRFKDLEHRDDLWRVLMALTRQKVVDRICHDHRRKRGEGDVRGESVFAKMVESGDERAGLEAFAGSTPTQEDLALIEEEVQRLFAALGPVHSGYWIRTARVDPYPLWRASLGNALPRSP